MLDSHGGRLSFFHEGFFDYVFARYFSGVGRSLLEFLQGTNQDLFLRAQVRQILTYQRDENFDQYLTDIQRDTVTHSVDCESQSFQAWRSVYQHHTQAITSTSECLQSNWLPVLNMPERIFFYDVLRQVKPSEMRAIASNCELPCFDHGRLIGSFANHSELQSTLGENVPIKLRGELKTQDFLQGNTGDILGIDPWDAKNKITSMVRQAWDNKMRSLGLVPYEMANGRFAWWFPEGIPEDGQLRYVDYSGKNRRRAVSGKYRKKEDSALRLLRC